MLPDLRVPSVDLNSFKMRMKDPSVQLLDTVLLTDIKQLGLDGGSIASKEEIGERKSVFTKKGGVESIEIDIESKAMELEPSEVNIGWRPLFSADVDCPHPLRLN